MAEGKVSVAKARLTPFTSVSSYPGIQRDMALVLPEKVSLRMSKKRSELQRLLKWRVSLFLIGSWTLQERRFRKGFCRLVVACNFAPLRAR